ncbi:MAG: TonB-dependent receptor [Alphaproteobacteria bacterium]|nr:TonB-dependent receptor [Alphaproteobacteria bacterium]
MKKLIYIFCLSVIVNSSFSQKINKILTGIVINQKGKPIEDAKLTFTNATLDEKLIAITNDSGIFRVDVPDVTLNITVVHIGYEYYYLEEYKPKEGKNLKIILKAAGVLENVVVTTGSRTNQRTLINSPIPIDVFSQNDLRVTGQPAFDKALQFVVPSFNSVNIPVNDATTLLDPYEIRNLGPSRSLILINGKRKNLSSLLYIQPSVARGEVGADLSAIPLDMIERVEILRDGASAHYGSDAIAGVLNVILKKKVDKSILNVSSGITSKGDGQSLRISLNSGFSFGLDNKSFFNYALGANKTDNAVRSTPIDPLGEIYTLGNPNASASDPVNQNIINYLNKYPTGNNINGTGATQFIQFSYNSELYINQNTYLYSNASVVLKNVLSNANFRQPYWEVDYGLLHTNDPSGTNYTNNFTLNTNGQEIYKGYLGFQPTFEGDLKDYNATLGLRYFNNGWSTDMSLTIGGNSQLYNIRNTVNKGLAIAYGPASSPINFKPGGYSFNHVVGNIDISKQLNKFTSIAFGSEFRKETYQIFAGDTASYSLSGSISFPGINQGAAGIFTRYNLGFYADLGIDIFKWWLVNGTYRYENYSDFGNASVWKLSTRFNILEDKIILRGSFSTGFRAPSIQQIYTQTYYTTTNNGSFAIAGLFNNQSNQARALGIPALKPEYSNNLTFGFGLKFGTHFSLTLDYYDIVIKDRILLSSSITSSNPSTDLYKILQQNNISKITFFINALETKTSGLDLVSNYKNIYIGNRANLNINLGLNYQLVNQLVGDPNANAPAAIKSSGASILNEQIESLITESRPVYKGILGFDFKINNLKIFLNNILFGPTKFIDIDLGSSPNIKQVFKPAVVTDLNVGYDFNSSISAYISINNIFNILPKWSLEAVNAQGQAELDATKVIAGQTISNRRLIESDITFRGRYRNTGYSGSQFSQLGTIFSAGITVRF